jgi:signal transduction histidine kinase
VQLLQTFADQAVIAIENTRLFDEVQAKTRDLEEALQVQTASAEVLKVISRSPDTLQPVFDVIVETSRQLCRAQASTIFTLRDGQFYLAAFAGVQTEVLQHMKDHPISIEQRGSALARSARERRTIHIPNTTEDPEFGAGSIIGMGDPRATLTVPLMREGQVIGGITLRQSNVTPFPQRQIEAIETFADQAVIAIENVRLFDEVQAKTRDLEEALQQQTATADVLKVISRSTFDLQTVLHTLVESAARLCGADQGTIARQKDGKFYRAESVGLSREFMDYVRDIPVALDRSTASGRALLEGDVVHIADVLADPEYTFNEAQRLSGLRTCIGVPVLREGVPVGVLSLTRSEVRPFSDKQIELVKTFADQAAIAIENARLFDEVQARTRELSKSLDDLRTAQDRLVQTEKLASLGQLTAGIAHEIKNPLNFVNNFSALSIELTDELNDLLKQAALADKLRGEVDELTGLLKDNLSKVVQHGKRADSIVKNMLLHSREGSGEHRPADVNALVDESLNLAYHGARAEKPQFDVNLQRDFDPDAGMIEAFPQEITRVLLNLISNGFYAVTKRKANDGSTGFEPQVIASTRGSSDHVEIRIRDNGIGIPPDVKEKMFNPFFTTKPAGEGTGLGLSMSHDIIVKQHGGTIDVQTEPGAFTEFTIILPRTSKNKDSFR